MKLAREAVIVAAREQISCGLSGEAVILQLQTGVYYGLNPVGAKVWELVQQPRTVAEIRDALVAEYTVDPETCERDVERLVEDLASRKLVEIHAAVG